MAVVDRLTDKGVKSDADGDTTLWRDVDYILPFRFLDTPVGCVDELHRPDVHMDGMVHGGDVCQHPFLDASDTDRGVDSLGSNTWPLMVNAIMGCRLCGWGCSEGALRRMPPICMPNTTSRLAVIGSARKSRNGVCRGTGGMGLAAVPLTAKVAKGTSRGGRPGELAFGPPIVGLSLPRSTVTARRIAVPACAVTRTSARWPGGNSTSAMTRGFGYLSESLPKSPQGCPSSASFT